MMHRAQIQTVAISSIDWLVDDLLSEPNQQLLPTCLAPHLMSMNHFLDLHKSSLGTRETHANQMCYLLPRQHILISSLLCRFLGMPFILSWRLYTSHTGTSLSLRRKFCGETCSHITKLPGCHCTLLKRVKKGYLIGHT